MPSRHLATAGWLLLLVDDNLARKQGKAIALGSMRHDPLLSHGRKTLSRFGRVLPGAFGQNGGTRV